MTVGQLLHGDRPWRATLQVARHPETPGPARRAALGASAALCWLAAVFAPWPFVLPAAGLTAALAGSLWSVAVVLVDGGRAPLSAAEVVGWSAHDELTKAEREHAEKAEAAKAKTKRRR